MMPPNFTIAPLGVISKVFLARNIRDFEHASNWIAQLDYKRNTDKYNLETIFTEQCGTCSTKHALLKTLADENGFEDLKLVLGIFKMNSENTHRIANTLSKYGLNYIPEAHNYLKYQDTILDFTRINAAASDFENDLLEEIEINPAQITDFKVNFHQMFLRKWLNQNPQITYNLAELWEIRELCVRVLAT